MQSSGDQQALGQARRPTTEPRLRGPTLISAPTFRATKLGVIEEVRLRHLRFVAILSLALVAVLETAQAGVLLAMSEPFGVPELIRDLVLKTPWSIIVCVALWSGLTFGRGSAVIAALVAWVAAPAASLTAHALAEMAATYTLSAMHEMLVSPYLVAAQKGVAYVTLALLVVRLWTRTQATAWQHAAAGLTVGLLFGGSLLLVEAEWGMRPVTNSVLVAWAANEVLFPVGCALLLWRVRARAMVADRRGGRQRRPGIRGYGSMRTRGVRRPSARCVRFT